MWAWNLGRESKKDTRLLDWPNLTMQHHSTSHSSSSHTLVRWLPHSIILIIVIRCCGCCLCPSAVLVTRLLPAAFIKRHINTFFLLSTTTIITTVAPVLIATTTTGRILTIIIIIWTPSTEEEEETLKRPEIYSTYFLYSSLECESTSHGVPSTPVVTSIEAPFINNIWPERWWTEHVSLTLWLSCVAAFYRGGQSASQPEIHPPILEQHQNKNSITVYHHTSHSSSSEWPTDRHETRLWSSVSISRVVAYPSVSPLWWP